MTTTPEPDQVAEVLARVAGEHHVATGVNATRVWAYCRCNADVELAGTDWPVTDARFMEQWFHIGTAHVAEAQAAALKAAGLVVEGTEVEEWGVRIGGAPSEPLAEKVARKMGAEIGRHTIRRTRTRYPDRVTEWVAVDEGGE